MTDKRRCHLQVAMWTEDPCLNLWERSLTSSLAFTRDRVRGENPDH